jgi:hypothetical protein
LKQQNKHEKWIEKREWASRKKRIESIRSKLEEYDTSRRILVCWGVHMKSSSRAEGRSGGKWYGIILKDTFENPRPDAQDHDALTRRRGSPREV